MNSSTETQVHACRWVKWITNLFFSDFSQSAAGTLDTRLKHEIAFAIFLFLVPVFLNIKGP
jgi:hypothetical protein